MRVRVQVASSQAEVLRCQYLIAEVYNKEYEVVFSKDRYDLDAKIEPWPHRYVMVLDGDTLVATAGLYLRDTYVERFGGITHADIGGMLAEAGATERYDATHLREVTKVVVSRAYRGRGLSRHLIGCAHSRGFLQTAGERPPLLVFCAKQSIVRSVHEASGLRTRPIKAFPFYRVHELYRSEADPMDSRLIIPDLDIPARWYNLDLPAEHDAYEMMKERS